MTSASLLSAAAVPSQGYGIRVVSTADEMESLRPFWEDLNRHPNAQIDYFRLINAIRGNILRPHIVLLERDGAPQGLILGRVEQQEFRCHLGYKSVGLGQVRQLSILHGGVLGCAEEEEAQMVLEALLAVLRRGEVDLLFFNHLDTESHLFRLASRRPGALCRDHRVAPQLHWKAKLPGTFTEFLQRLNKKHRYWLRRLQKQIEQDFPGRVSYRSFPDGQQLDGLMNDLERVASKTYQRGLGAGFRNDADQHRRLALEAEKNWLRIHVLYVENRPCAFWIGRLYKRVFHSDVTGYDPEFRNYELGTIIFMKMVEHLCREQAEAIDFGLGDALYKQRFGDQSWHEAIVRVFSPRFHGVARNLAQTAIETPASCLRSFLNRVNLQQRLKTLWRRRLLQGREE